MLIETPAPIQTLKLSSIQPGQHMDGNSCCCWLGLENRCCLKVIGQCQNRAHYWSQEKLNATKSVGTKMLNQMNSASFKTNLDKIWFASKEPMNTHSIVCYSIEVPTLMLSEPRQHNEGASNTGTQPLKTFLPALSGESPT